MTEYTLRQATPDDAETIAAQRVSMFCETRPVAADVEVSLRATLPDLLRGTLESGQYVGWLVEHDSAGVIAGAGVMIRWQLPRTETLVPCEALIVNVYVAPEHRRQGLARRMMDIALKWAREQGIERVALHASSMGRPLYEALGFVPSAK